MSYVSNGRRRTTRRRGMRRNGSSRMRRNGIMGAFQTGGLIMGGFVAHKLLTGLISNYAFKPAVEAAAPDSTTTDQNGQPTSGLGQVQAYSGLLVGGALAAVGVLLAEKAIKSAETRRLVQGGIAASFLQSLIVAAFDKFNQPEVATMLAGVEDGTATKISAMYGLGAGTSIQPEYTPIGEYFRSGVGEYFRSGVGEYFQSGVQGLGALKPYEASAGIGNYGQNPDIYQAAAGTGAIEARQSNHIDPSSDLDRELNIAEAAAGVGNTGGNLYQAAAGFGATPVTTVPRSSTWIPGESDPAIWAGTRSIKRHQSADEMLTAGILQTDGGQGVFG